MFFVLLGKIIGVTCVVVVGGMDINTQARELCMRPHIIVATPGRLVDHLKKTKGFNLKALKYLVSIIVKLIPSFNFTCFALNI